MKKKVIILIIILMIVGILFVISKSSLGKIIKGYCLFGFEKCEGDIVYVPSESKVISIDTMLKNENWLYVKHCAICNEEFSGTNNDNLCYSCAVITNRCIDCCKLREK